MEITFLGTASHTPTAKRNHTGILVSFDNENILIDCGEGIQRQLKIAKKNPCKLTRILITHWHGDHTLGIPGLLQTLAMAEYSKTLHIYGPRGTKEKFNLLEKLYNRFMINYEIHEISKETIVDEKQFKIEAKKMDHGVPAYAYAIEIKEKRRIKKAVLKKHKIPNSPLLGKLQAGKNVTIGKVKLKAKDATYLQESKKVTIIMDTQLNENAIKLAKDSDVLICESSFHSDEEHLAKERKHLTAQNAATIAKKAHVKKLAITHISHRYAARPKELLEEAKKVFKNTILPRDLDEVKI